MNCYHVKIYELGFVQLQISDCHELRVEQCFILKISTQSLQSNTFNFFGKMMMFFADSATVKLFEIFF